MSNCSWLKEQLEVTYAYKDVYDKEQIKPCIEEVNTKTSELENTNTELSKTKGELNSMTMSRDIGVGVGVPSAFLGGSCIAPLAKLFLRFIK